MKTGQNGKIRFKFIQTRLINPSLALVEPRVDVHQVLYPHALPVIEPLDGGIVENGRVPVLGPTYGRLWPRVGIDGAVEVEGVAGVEDGLGRVVDVEKGAFLGGDHL